MSTPNQSATFNAHYTAIGILLGYKLAALNVDPSKIFLSWRSPERALEGENVCFYRFSGGYTPQQHPGAGRLAANVIPVLEVILQTRSNLDQMGRDDVATTDTTYGHDVFQLAVIDALDGVNLFDEYDDDTEEPVSDATPLTVEPTQLLPSGEVSIDESNPGWLFSTLKFAVSAVFPLTQ